ncbi:hypothetical protein [Pedobacter jejuensis]|uniref:Uncharacterized protein n=1 Tax=Pedobacter jejuensis TaxID=1268550 RepID=A0A3N0BLY7_9SPHI|nr:hypothetical protein [Pedobacter jejuensis]RNL49761.1 hypothetical protein D7004_20355 [Pedobacter jejuensis]
MKKALKIKNHLKNRQKYQEKRLGPSYKRNRKNRLKRWKSGINFSVGRTNNTNQEIVNLPAPQNFSLILNTNSVLSYLEIARKNLKKNRQIIFDISEITNLTPDTIPLLISHIKDPAFRNSTTIHGNAPNEQKFKKLFTESGFYNHVKGTNQFEVSAHNIMHKESNFKVKPDLAGDIVDMIMDKGKFSNLFIEPIYNIFIELMSNTHHHADLSEYGTSKWWLFLFVDNENGKISISFIDLGVGIFKSVVVESYIKRIGLTTKLVDNSILVRDLLNGKIQSRIEKDNEIRGKGIPQVVEYAKYECFKRFYLITNDIMIDLKDNSFVKLASELNGTFYHLELDFEI